jgi:DNA-nicking Smr family endonuclease
MILVGQNKLDQVLKKSALLAKTKKEIEDVKSKNIYNIFKYRNYKVEYKDFRLDLHGLTFEESRVILDIRLP